MWKILDKHRGARTELAACIYLLGEGYEVFRNISASGSADLIAWKGDEVLRIDVKSGKSAKLTPKQEKEGVVILHVDENGHCELDTVRKRRVAKGVHEVLTKITGMLPKEGAEHLKQCGITTPNGAQWTPRLVVQMRQRLGLAA
jgi:Holliday junction resolvase